MTLDIVVKSGVTPVHGFDLWGTLVDQIVFGPRVIEAYHALASANVESRTGKSVGTVAGTSAGTDEEMAQIATNIQNYQGVLDGKDWATGARKKEFVDAVEEPLWQAYARGEASVNFEGALYTDALSVMSDIVASKEGLCIITTGNSFWIKKALKDASPAVGEAMGEVYFGNKSTPAPFDTAMEDLVRQGRQLVSHTEDQIKGFAGLFDSKRAMYVTGDEHLIHRLIPSCMFQIATVYVERGNPALATEEQVKSAGISMYVTDLRNVPYTTFVNK